MQFITIIALALPLTAAAPPAETPSPARETAAIIDRDAFNASTRSVVLEVRKKR
jgi:hypothetical protein